MVSMVRWISITTDRDFAMAFDMCEPNQTLTKTPTTQMFHFFHNGYLGKYWLVVREIF